MDWAPSITFCATTRERSWRAACLDDQITYTASVTQWPVTIWTSFSFWHCSSTRPWWQVQEHEHYLSTQQWASTCIRATPHTYSGYHCPGKHFNHERAVQPRFWSVLYFFHQARRENNIFRMIVVRVAQKTFCFPFLLTCSICSCQTVSHHIFGTKAQLRLCIKKVQLRPPKIIVCWLSMVYRHFKNLVMDLLTDWACWT